MLRRVAAIAALLLILAAGCSSPTTTAVASTDGPIATTPEPRVAERAEAAVPIPTAVATTAPVSEPTVVPTPTSFAVPVPTPQFGPTGRPTSAGAVHVLTATSAVSRPTVYDGPDGNEVSVSYTYLDGSVDSSYDYFTNPTYFGNPLALLVVEGTPGDDWARVQIPTRPITTGWVETAEFTWSSSDFYVRINVADNTVTVWDGDEIVVDSTPAVTGDAGRETPITSTYVDEIMRGPSSAYGPWLLSLGVFSDAINTFSGGLPKVALHGTNAPDLLGQYASNGCIRVHNDVITLLAETVPVGTRVDIINQA